MKRKSLIVMLAVMLVSSVVPLTAAAASGQKSNVVALTDVKSTDSNGVKRSIDNDFVYAPIGKPKSPSKMLTPPPPANKNSNEGMIGTLSVSPSNLYLIDATAYLGISSTNKLSVSGDTAASQKVDEIVGQVFLLRWNGSSWDTYATYPASSRTNTAFLTVSKSNITAPTGYYYETNYVTYIRHNNRLEAEDKYSGYLWHSSN